MYYIYYLVFTDSNEGTWVRVGSFFFEIRLMNLIITFLFSIFIDHFFVWNYCKFDLWMNNTTVTW